jgi:enoyl-CoA hydratase/carnithine racemase
VGKSKAMDMILTGRMMDAAEAERAGLVSRIVPADRLVTEALEARCGKKRANIALSLTNSLNSTLFLLSVFDGKDPLLYRVTESIATTLCLAMQHLDISEAEVKSLLLAMQGDARAAEAAVLAQMRNGPGAADGEV